MDAAMEARGLYDNAGTAVINGRDSFETPWVDVAWWVYDSTLRACRSNAIEGLIAGGLRSGRPGEPGGAGIDDILRENLKTIDERVPGVDRGAILHTRNWSILVNDSWLLGGVHSTAPFYLASERRQENLYLAPKLKVFGRELANLRSFGYRIVMGAQEATGEAAVLPDAADPKADFVFCQSNATEYETGENWRVLEGKIGEPWD
ncbi:hypothetical protein IQ279_14250 [Streptomyces verrucosisporus]|uniref:hypothetical protein n=1 Tax=Streptomyces verrucosisporus TaxID=1695161 RepID=UPI0019D0C875|nr:hypothetical protein [Streptomyces verrucosisporus]MBN3930783.1 hypothetical protein [Streptomyces verrucosisporus]